MHSRVRSRTFAKKHFWLQELLSSILRETSTFPDRWCKPWRVAEVKYFRQTSFIAIESPMSLSNATEHDQLLEKITQLFASAITSISTRASFGNRATSTVDRAGAVAPKYFA